jgi:hypothetical protein
MSELDKIKAKLKKLFALSRSSNANEAAIALEMAQKLMIEHGIKRNDVGEFEIVEEDIKGSGNERPPKYEVYLTSNIATAFCCKIAYGWVKSISENSWGYFGHTFVGLDYRVEIACFISDVLLRKLKRARADYLKTLTRVRSRTNKIKRADEFCFGWAYTVVTKLIQLTLSDKELTAIDNYVAGLCWGKNLKTISRGTVKGSDIDDFAKGRRAAADVQIQNGITGHESQARLIGAGV